jgi:CRP/FNR family transcriptional regulator, cyclic AMP receptor protein
MTATTRELPDCEIFDSITPAQRIEVLRLMEPQSFEPGMAILEEGEHTRGLWVIKEGRCEVVKSGPHGTAQTIAELSPGCVFGEMSFFQTAPHSATVRALTHVSTLYLSAKNYAKLEETCLAAAHRLSHAISVILAGRLRRMDDWTTHLLDQAAPSKHEEWSDFRAKLYNDLDF